MDGSPFTTKTKIHSGPIAAQLGCVTLLSTDSPHTFIETHAPESMERTDAASAICERSNSPRLWGGGRQAPASPDLYCAQACSSSTTTNQLQHASCRHTSFHPNLCHTTCYPDKAAGSGSMTAPAVRWLPAHATIGFSESLMLWLPGLHGATAFVPDCSTHSGRFRLLYASDTGIALSFHDRLVDVGLVSSNGAQSLAGFSLVVTLHAAAEFSP